MLSVQPDGKRRRHVDGYLEVLKILNVSIPATWFEGLFTCVKRRELAGDCHQAAYIHKRFKFNSEHLLLAWATWHHHRLFWIKRIDTLGGGVWVGVTSWWTLEVWWDKLLEQQLQFYRGFLVKWILCREKAFFWIIHFIQIVQFSMKKRTMMWFPMPCIKANHRWKANFRGTV